jgi:hypothetical protein
MEHAYELTPVVPRSPIACALNDWIDRCRKVSPIGTSRLAIRHLVVSKENHFDSMVASKLTMDKQRQIPCDHSHGFKNP